MLSKKLGTKEQREFWGVKKMVKMCCKTCGFAEWQRNQANARMFDRPGNCNCPIPKLPDAYRLNGTYQQPVKKRNIIADQGKNCECWEQAKEKKVGM